MSGESELQQSDNPAEDCLDIRELAGPDAFDADSMCELTQGRKFHRVYAGSSFCPNYFLNCGIYPRLIAHCKEKGIRIGLSVCVFPQSLVKLGMQAVRRLLSDGDGVIDELVVNDIGMLRFASDELGLKVMLGRLFFKDARDCRRPEFIARRTSFSLLSCRSLLEEWQPSGIEIDPISAEIDLSHLPGSVGTVVLDSPFCYMSFGNVCRAASAFRPIREKFRSSAPCELECLRTASVHTDRLRKDAGKLYMVGKTVYFGQPSVRLVHPKETVIRKLYFPLQEFIGRLQETAR